MLHSPGWMRTAAALGVAGMASLAMATVPAGAGGHRVAERGAAQPGLRKLRTLGGPDGTLYQVRAAAFRGTELVVATGGDPALHLFGAGEARSWGRKGSGPAELTYAADVAWAGDRILVRDADQERLVTYDAGGRLLASRPLRPLMTSHFVMVGADTLVGLVRPGSVSRAVLRLNAARHDTVLRYSLPRQVQLRAEGSPSLSVTPPYADVPLWTVMSDGRIVYWDGAGAQLRTLDRAGRSMGTISLPAERYPVTSEARELWLQTAIPQSFHGQRLFEPVRAAARRDVTFPARLPRVLEMMADPAGGVWIRRTTSAQGELWTWLRPGTLPATLRLPRGQSLLAVGPGQLAVLAKDEMDVERIDVYAHPFHNGAPR